MAGLTPRESEVLALIGRGLHSREIAATLGIAVFTVRKHRSNILGKLGLHSTAQLVAHAVKATRQRVDAPACTRLEVLSPRQRQVLALVGQGLTSKRIARTLGISPATVRKHRENASARLAASGLPMSLAAVVAALVNTASELFTANGEPCKVKSGKHCES